MLSIPEIRDRAEIVARCWNAVDPEDIAQDVVVKALGIEGGVNSVWVKRAVRSSVIDRLRHGKTAERHALRVAILSWREDPSALDLLLLEESERAAGRMLDEIAKRNWATRLLIDAKRADPEVSFAEVVRRSGRNQNTAKVHLHRCRISLREALGHG